ncbi:MAG: hypothetical protein LBL17_00590 [Coxiellaceae bacterium]|nr:hypothetical protein [Coxiellaceae bacterium]
MLLVVPSSREYISQEVRDVISNNEDTTNLLCITDQINDFIGVIQQKKDSLELLKGQTYARLTFDK